MAESPKGDATTETVLVPKLIRWPQDWVERVDQVQGEQSFSDFVRTAVHMLIDNGELSVPSAGGSEDRLTRGHHQADSASNGRRAQQHRSGGFNN